MFRATVGSRNGTEAVLDETELEKEIVLIGWPLEEGQRAKYKDCTSSKIGGDPYWTEYCRPHSLERDLLCGKCGKKLVFVGQIYAPVDEQVHRTLYVFACNERSCHSLDSLVVIRLQQQVGASSVPDTTTKSNSIEAEEAGKQKQKATTLLFGETDTSENVSLDDLESMLLASRMESDSKSKNKTKKKKKEKPGFDVGSGVMLQVDEEPYVDHASGTKKHIKDMLKRYNEMQREQGEEEWTRMDDLKINDEEEGTVSDGEDGDDDVSFLNLFDTRLERVPEQCLRYAYGGVPLWPRKPYHLSVPPCEGCRHPRVFECQLLPSVLWHLEKTLPKPTGEEEQQEGADGSNTALSLDWSSIFIFSCPNSCENSHKEEGFIISPF